MGSFVKMFVVNVISRNIDGYTISSFLYKDRDSKGGTLAAGPPWDYDISYGNADYCQGNRSDLFAYKFNHTFDLQYRKFNPDQNGRVAKKRKGKE